jgi:hypothetical protein
VRRNKLNGLTRIGLLIAAAGWVVLLVGERLGAHLASAAPTIGVPWLPEVDRSGLANALLLTGFGLAILGALQQGFGALNRFFDAVLGNLAAPSAKPDRATVEFEAAMAQPAPVPARRPEPAAVRTPEPLRKPPRPPVRPPGVAKQTVRDDGTAEVETLLGVRRFNSEKEAREFLGA